MDVCLIRMMCQYRCVPAPLTHWGRVTHICVGKLTVIGSDNGLSPERRQAIIWTNAVILLIGPLETNFSEILIEILMFSFKKMRLKVSSAKRRSFCLGLNVLMLLRLNKHGVHDLQLHNRHFRTTTWVIFYVKWMALMHTHSALVQVVARCRPN